MSLHNFLFISVALCGGASFSALFQYQISHTQEQFTQNAWETHTKDSLNGNFLIQGTVLTRATQAVADVQISLYADTVLVQTTLTDAQGHYSFLGDTSINIYRVKAEKLNTDDKYKGITTFDIARVRKHIIGVEYFTSPFEHLAADVDKNNEVDAADVVLIHNFILRKQAFLPSGVWRFMDNTYQFTNLSNPLAENIPNEIVFKKGNILVNLDFLAIKMGDVNATYFP